MKENVLKNKCFAFAIRIVKLYQYLCDKKKEFVLSKQVLCSGTSIGAMVFESKYILTKEFENLNTDAIEIIKMATSIIKTAKSSINQ